MSNKDLFQRAIEAQLRFPTPTGQLTVEQLYQLNDTKLNEMYIAVDKAIEEKSGSRGLLSTSDSSKSSELRELELKRDILKEVFLSKAAKKEAAKRVAEKRNTIATLKEVLNQKKNEEILSKSTAEIEEMLKNLGAE